MLIDVAVISWCAHILDNLSCCNDVSRRGQQTSMQRIIPGRYRDELTLWQCHCQVWQHTCINKENALPSSKKNAHAAKAPEKTDWTSQKTVRSHWNRRRGHIHWQQRELVSNGKTGDRRLFYDGGARCAGILRGLFHDILQLCSGAHKRPRNSTLWLQTVGWGQ